MIVNPITYLTLNHCSSPCICNAGPGTCLEGTNFAAKCKMLFPDLSLKSATLLEFN